MLVNPRFCLPLAALLAVSTACKRQTKGAEARATFTREGGRLLVPEGSPLREALHVQAAEDREVKAELTVPATVEADPTELVKVLTPLTGRIVQLHVHLGDWVQKGQALATLDSADLASAFSDLTKARAAFAQARRSVERVRELGLHDIASKREVDQAETDFAAAESEWKRSEARIVQLGANPGKDRLLVLRSPIAGRISDLTAASGGYWNDLNAPLMVVANLAKVWLTASVQEKDIPSVFVGQEVRATLASLPQEPLTSRVAFVGEMLDPDTRTAKVRAPCDNASHRMLPAMFANAAFQLKPHRGVMVPTSALVQSQEGPRVFVETAAWTFQARPVKVGPQVNGWTEIVEGLKAGERIITKEGVVLND